MSHRRKTEPNTARGDATETIEGVLVYARIDGLTLHRDRAGRVLVALGADPRGSVLLEPDAVARLHHALGCSLWPYGEKPEET